MIRQTVVHCGWTGQRSSEQLVGHRCVSNLALLPLHGKSARFRTNSNPETLLWPSQNNFRLFPSLLESSLLVCITFLLSDLNSNSSYNL